MDDIEPQHSIWSDQNELNSVLLKSLKAKF